MTFECLKDRISVVKLCFYLPLAFFAAVFGVFVEDPEAACPLLLAGDTAGDELLCC